MVLHTLVNIMHPKSVIIPRVSDKPREVLVFAINPLPHGVLASFHLTAGGLPRPPKEGDISREKTIMMTSLRV